MRSGSGVGADSLALGRDALVGEIKEEGSAAGRRRGTFAGKGIVAQSPTDPPVSASKD